MLGPISPATGVGTVIIILIYFPPFPSVWTLYLIFRFEGELGQRWYFEVPDHTVDEKVIIRFEGRVNEETKGTFTMMSS